MVSRLEALARQAQHGPLPDLDDAWQAFAADLETDLGAHEREVFAAAHRGVSHREHARRVAQENAAARALVEEIGRQIERRRPRAASFDLLADILRGRVAARGDLQAGNNHLS